MPIYEYSCEPCHARWKEMHGANDKGGRCQSCGVLAPRVLPTGTTVLTQASTAGKRVEKYIEENREIVREQIEEARREYKP